MAIVIRCSHCRGLMRVDQTRIPSGGKVKVRCPHCKGVGFAEGTSGVSPADRGPVPVAAEEQGPLEPVPTSRSDFPAGDTSAAFDLKIPEDSFQAFRFPVEEEVDRPMSRRVGTGMKILLWLGISLAVIGIFALLVNIILPGPQGGRLH